MLNNALLITKQSITMNHEYVLTEKFIFKTSLHFKASYRYNFSLLSSGQKYRDQLVRENVRCEDLVQVKSIGINGKQISHTNW